MNNKFTFGDVGRIIIAIGAFLTVFMSGAEQVAVLGATAVLIVWILNFVFEKFGFMLGKVPLTIFLFVLSIGAVAYWQPEMFPAWPLVVTVASVFEWIGALLLSAAPIVTMATGLYNMLLASILEKLNYQLTLMAKKTFPQIKG